MSTRSVVAIPYGDVWRGRYVHSDGYPTHMGRELFVMVQRYSLETVIDVLTQQHYGWSYLDAEQPDIAGVTPNRDAKYGTPEYLASQFSGDSGQRGSYSDGRFVNVPNYGIAYTTTDGQSGSEDWFMPDPDNWTEWVYVLTISGLLVIETPYKKPDVVVGLFDWNANHDWEAIQNSGMVAV